MIPENECYAAGNVKIKKDICKQRSQRIVQEILTVLFVFDNFLKTHCLKIVIKYGRDERGCNYVKNSM